MAESSGRKTGGGGGGGGGGGSTSSHLATTYPVNTIMELKLSDGRPPIRGLIYCTDEISNTIVLKKSLVHTTLSSEITVVNAECVMEYKDITKDIISVNGDGGGDDNNSNEEEKKALRELAGVSNLNELKLPLPNVSGKVLEERERRAIKLAEESFSHINQKVRLLMKVDVIVLYMTCIVLFVIMPCCFGGVWQKKICL